MYMYLCTIILASGFHIISQNYTNAASEVSKEMYIMFGRITVNVIFILIHV